MSIAGKWRVTMDTPMGTQTFVWDLAAIGANWVGSMQGPTGASTLNSIEIDDDQFAWETDVSSPMGRLHLTFDGARLGDTLSGNCITMFGAQSFAGTRA